MTSTSSVQDKIQVFINSHPEYEGKPLSEISSELVSAGVLTTEELGTLDSTSTFSIANKKLQGDDNVDSFEHADNSAASKTAETTETIIEHGNEVIVKKKGDELIEKVIKEKIPNSEEVKTITISYSKGKPFTKKIEEGDKTEEYLYTSETLENGEEVIAIKKVAGDGKSVEQTIVKNVDENGDYTDDDFEYRKTLYLEDTATGSNIGVKAGSVKEVGKSKKGDLIESVSDPSGEHVVTTQFNGGSVTKYDEDKLYFKRQEVADNGNVTSSANYDGKGNTYVTIRNGDGVESITTYFNNYIKKHGLDKARQFTQADFEALNKRALQGNGLQVGQKALVPTQYNANAPILTKRGTPEQAVNKYSQFAFEQTKERLATSTIVETTLNKTYSSYEELAKEQLVAQGVKNPTKAQINDRANELMALNTTKDGKLAALKKGTKFSVVSNQASESDVGTLKSAGLSPTFDNNAFYKKFNSLSAQDRQKVMSVVKACKGMRDINKVKAMVYENTGVNLYDTNLTVNEYGTTSAIGMNMREEFKQKMPLEYFLTKRMGLDLSSKSGKEVYARMRLLSQSELDKISAAQFTPEGVPNFGRSAVGSISVSKNASVKDIIGTMYTQGVELRTSAEIRVEQSSPRYQERQRKEQAISMLYDSVKSAYDLINDHLDELKSHMISNAGEIAFEDLKIYAVPDVVKQLASYLSNGDGTVEGLTKSIYDKRDELQKTLFQINQLRNSKNFEADYKKLTGHDYNSKGVQTYMDMKASLSNPVTKRVKTPEQLQKMHEQAGEMFIKLVGGDRSHEAQKFKKVGETGGSVLEMAAMIYMTGGMGELGYIKNAGSAAMKFTGSRAIATGVRGALTLGTYTAGRESLNVIDDFANANGFNELTVALGDRGMKVLEHTASSELFGFVGGATAEKIFTMSKGAQNFVSNSFSKLFGTGTSNGAVSTFISDTSSTTGSAFSASSETVAVAEKALGKGTELSGSQFMSKVVAGTNSLNTVGKAVSIALETLTFSGVEISEQAVTGIVKELFNSESELKQAISNNTLEDYIKTKVKNAPESILNTLKEQGINMLMLKAVSFAIGARSANNLEGQYETLDKSKIYKTEIDGEIKVVVETSSGKMICNSTADALAFLHQAMSVETMIKSAETTKPENEFEWAQATDVTGGNSTNPVDISINNLPIYTRNNLPENTVVMPSTNLVISTVTSKPVGRLDVKINNPIEDAKKTGFTEEQRKLLESKGVDVEALNDYLRLGFKPKALELTGMVPDMSFYENSGSSSAVNNSQTPYAPTQNPVSVKRTQKDVFRINEVLTDEELSTDASKLLVKTQGDKYKLSEIGDKLAFKIAEQINKVAQEAEPDILRIMHQTGLSKGQKFTYRSKSVQSLHDKIQNALADAMKEGKPINLEKALDGVKDAEGVRTIFEAKDYTNHPEVQELLQKGDREGAIRRASELQSNDTFEALKGYIDSVAEGTNEVEITRMSNYMGKDGIPYFSENQLMALKQYANSKGVKMPIFERVTIKEEADGSRTEESNPKATTKVRGSGYTALQMNFKTKNGFIFEGQFRGPSVDTFAEAEHVPYDIRTDKDIIGVHTELTNIYSPIIEMLKGENKISDIMFDEHSAYLTAHYEYLRQTELGFEDGTNPPKFPRGLDARLRAENLELLHEYVEKIKKEPEREAEFRAEYESKLVQNTPENTTDVRYNPVSPERLAYENAKEQLKKLKDENGQPRFEDYDIAELKDELTSNSDLVLKLAEMKNLDGTYRFNPYTLSAAMKLRADIPEIVDGLLNMKKSDGSLAIDINMELALTRIEGLNDKEYVLSLINEKDSQGTSRFANSYAFDAFERIYDTPEKRAKFKEIYDTRTSDGRYKYSMGMVHNLSDASDRGNADFEELKSRYDAISDYMRKNDIPLETEFKDNIEESKNDPIKALLSKNKEKNIVLSYENNGSTVQVTFDSNGKFINKRVLSTQQDVVEEALVTNDNSSKMSISYDTDVKAFKKMLSSTKEVKDNQGNLLYTEKYVESKDAAGKYNIVRTDVNGREWIVGLAEHSKSGNLVIEKSLQGTDGTKTDYFYSESPKGERISVTKITDKDGNVLLNNSQKFKVIDENHFQSVENGETYDIQFSDDKIVVKKDDGKTVELKIGDRDSKLYINPNIVPLLKKLSGSVLFDMDTFGLKEIGVGINNVQEGNAHFNPKESLLSLSSERFKNDEVFILLHELGHMKDYNTKGRITNNAELNEIFKEEFANFKKNQSSMEADAISYLTTSTFGHGGLEEMVADTNAYLYGNNKWDAIELRGQYLQQYFPKSFAKIAELLKTANPKENAETSSDSSNGILGVTPTTAEFDEVAFREDLKSQTQHKTSNNPRFTDNEIDELVELRKKYPEVETLVNFQKGIPFQLKFSEIKQLLSYSEKNPEMYNVVINNFDKFGFNYATELLESNIKDSKFLESIVNLKSKDFKGEEVRMLSSENLYRLASIHSNNPEFAENLVERFKVINDSFMLMTTIKKLPTDLYPKANELVSEKVTLDDGTESYALSSSDINLLMTVYEGVPDISEKLKSVLQNKTIDNKTKQSFQRQLVNILRDTGSIKSNIVRGGNEIKLAIENLNHVKNPTTSEDNMLLEAGVTADFVEGKYLEKYGENSFAGFSKKTISLLNEFYKTNKNRDYNDYMNSLLGNSINENAVIEFLNKDVAEKNMIISQLENEQNEIIGKDFSFQSDGSKTELDKNEIPTNLALMKKYNPENYDKLIHSKGFKMIKEGKLNANLLSSVKAMDTIDEDYFYNLFDAKEQDFNSRYESSSVLKEYDKDLLFKIIDLDPTKQDEILRYIETAKDSDLMKFMIEKNFIKPVVNQELIEKNNIFELPSKTQDRVESLVELMRMTSRYPKTVKRGMQYKSNIPSLSSLCTTELSVRLTNEEKDAVYTLFNEAQQKYNDISATDVQSALKFMEKYKDIDILKTLTSQKQNLKYSAILNSVNENNMEYFKTTLEKENGVLGIPQLSLLEVTKAYPEMKNPDSPEAQRIITTYYEVLDGLNNNISEKGHRWKNYFHNKISEINSRSISEAEKEQAIKEESARVTQAVIQIKNSLYSEAYNRKGLIDIKLNDPEKYERIKESGLLDMVDSGKFSSSVLRKLNVNTDLAPEVYADLEAVKKGESIIPEFREGTTIPYAFNKTKIGDAVAIGDKMYINDGTNLVEWKMTKEKYLELFPPVTRYLNQQGALGDCYFVTSLTGSMYNPQARVGIYKSFEQNGNDVSVTIKDYEEYGGTKTFKNSKIEFANQNAHIIGAKGLQMYEQTYANVAFRESYKDPTPLTETDNQNIKMQRIVGGSQPIAMSEIHSIGEAKYLENVPDDFETGSIGIYNITPEKLTDLLTRFGNNDNVMLGFGTNPKENKKAESIIDSRYNLVSQHAYTIRGYNAEKGTVTINNPHNAGLNTEIPIDILAKNMNHFDITVLNKGVIKPATDVSTAKVNTEEISSEIDVANNSSDGSVVSENSIPETSNSTLTREYLSSLVDVKYGGAFI